jgi:translocation and assembly module TamB
MSKRKILFRVMLGAAMVLAIVAAIAAAVLRSAAFHRYILAKIVQKASQATGAKVEIGDYRLELARLRVELDRIVAHGTEPGSQPPLLALDHLTVGLRIVSLWRGEIRLSEIVADHPSIHLSVDAHGHSNLPSPPKAASSGSSSTNIFDLAIGHVVVNRGELDYNDRRVPLEGDVHDLEAKVDSAFLKSEYDGEFGYHSGRLEIGGFNPIVHTLDAKFAATPAGINIESIHVAVGKSSMTVEGQLSNYANPTVEGTYQASAVTGEIGRILNVDAMPAGKVDLKGTLHYQNRADHPFLDNVETEGDFHSDRLAVAIDPVRADVRAIQGKFSVKDGTLEVANARGAALGGNVAGGLTIAHLADTPAAKLDARIRGISLEAASAALESQPLKRTMVSGKLDGTLNTTWTGAGEQLRLRADATISASTGAAPNSEASAIPLHGNLHLVYDNPSQTLTVRDSKLSTPHTDFTMDGTAGKQSSLALGMQSGDLRDVDQLALMARLAFGSDQARKAGQPQLLGLAGAGSFNGRLRGASGAYDLSGQLNSAHFQYHDTVLSLLHANIDLNPSRLTVTEGQLHPADGGLVEFAGSVNLSDWAFRPSNTVQADFTASGVQAATLEGAASLHYPVSGTFAGHASLRGTESNLDGSGNLALTQGVAWQQPFQSLSAQFQVAGQSVHSTLQLASPAGSGSGDVKYDFSSRSYDVQLSLPHLQLDQVNAMASRQFPVSGTLNATVQGKGTLKRPQLAAVIAAPNLTVGQQSFSGFQLRASVVDQRASFVVESTASGAAIQGHGTVDLTGNYPLESELDVKNIALGAVLADFTSQIPQDVGGQAELHANLHGPLRQRNRLEGEVNIPKLNLSYRTIQIGNARPLHAVYRSGVISLDPCEFKGTGTDVNVRAAVPLAGGQKLQAAADGTVDFHLLQIFAPNWNGSGQAQLDLNAAGTRAHPDLNGTIRLNHAALESPDSPIGIENVNGAIALRNGRLEIQTVKGEAGGGTFTVQGFANYQPSLQYNLGLTARRVRLRYPVGTRAVLNANLVLTGTKKSGLLSGQVTIDRLSLTKDFDLGTFADQFDSISTPSSGPSLADSIKLAVSLKSARDMALASSKLSVRGSADLMIRGTAAEPVLLGRTDITGGEIFFGGNRYTVESGVVQFVNPVHTEPVVNIVVTTTVQQFDISMNFTGPIDRLRTTYTSDPPLAPVDIINLVATGHTTEAASTSQTSPESVIAGQLTGQFSSRVEKFAGVSSLTIDPQVGGAQGNTGRLAVQQRVTKNLYFTFSTDLRSSTGQIVEVEYQVSKRYAVSTTRDENGGYTVEVKVHKRF